jgi:hypothetical protein
MTELRKILAKHSVRSSIEKAQQEVREYSRDDINSYHFSDIPDVIFDDVVVKSKISRVEMLVYLYFYRHVWCRFNLFRDYGISPVLSLSETSKLLEVTLDELNRAIHKLESLELMETIRLGQYFVRKFGTKSHDEMAGQRYSDFE